uniref:Uncharacterized protein n=1 Tax=Magallana gigas TaxID=29159 RepID=K1RJB9_MAGGI
MLAVEMDDIRMVRHLIKAGANVNATDNLGKTPLLLALEDGKFEIAEYLIKHGSDVNSVDDLGQSALLHITRGERRDCARIIRILLQCDYKIKEKIDEISREEIVTYQKQQERKIPTLGEQRKLQCLKDLHQAVLLWHRPSNSGPVIVRKDCYKCGTTVVDVSVKVFSSN